MTTYYTDCTIAPKSLNTNFFDLFCKYVNQKEKKNDKHPPPENILHATKWNVNSESDELAILTSHGSRMINDFENRKISYLIYSGKTLTSDSDFNNIISDINYVINYEHVQVNKLLIGFGGNDVYNALRTLNSSDETYLRELSKQIIAGNENAEWENIDASDPLNLFINNDSLPSVKINSFLDVFFQKVDALIKFFPSAKVMCLIPGPRFLKSVEDHAVYNSLCYILQRKFYNFALGKNIVLINTFLKEYLRGTKNLLSAHSFKEQVYVAFQHVKPTRYGAVHYSRLKYQEMYDAISVALDHDDSLIFKSWEKDNGVYVHFLLGNKGAHFYNGNIANSIENQRDGDSSKKEGGNFGNNEVNSFGNSCIHTSSSSCTKNKVESNVINTSGKIGTSINFFQHFMLGNKGGHLIYGNINSHTKNKVMGDLINTSGSKGNSIKNLRDGESSKKEGGNISFFQHFMLGNKGGHLVHGNIKSPTKKKDIGNNKINSSSSSSSSSNSSSSNSGCSIGSVGSIGRFSSSLENMIAPLILSNHSENSCFANCIIHLLRNVPSFLENIQTAHNTDAEILIKNIFSNIGSNQVSTTRNLRRYVGYQFDEQEDACEFLTILLQLLQDRNSSIFQFRFQIQLHFLMNNQPSSCKNCKKNLPPQADVDNMLKLELPTSNLPLTLSDLIQGHFSRKCSDEGEEYGRRCSFCCKHGDSTNHHDDIKCKNQPYVQQKIMTKFPSFLIIQLNRFSQELHTKSLHKNHTHVMAENNISIQNTQFEIIGAIEHKGSTLKSGHYLTYLKASSGNWFMCDDNSIPIPKTENNVLKELNMYIYLFKRCDSHATTNASMPKQATFTKTTSSSAQMPPPPSLLPRKNKSSQSSIPKATCTSTSVPSTNISGSKSPENTDKTESSFTQTTESFFPLQLATSKVSHCKVCRKYFTRFLKHLNNSPKCRKHYDMDQVKKDIKEKEKERKRKNKQDSRKKRNEKIVNEIKENSTKMHLGTAFIPIANMDAVKSNEIFKNVPSEPKTSDNYNIDDKFKISEEGDDFSTAKINLYFKDQREKSKSNLQKSRYEIDIGKDFKRKCDEKIKYENKRYGRAKDRTEQNKLYYLKNQDEIKQKRKFKYASNPELEKERKKLKYASNPEPKKEKFKLRYASNPELEKERKKLKYASNPEPIKLQRKSRYDQNKEKEKEKQRLYQRKRYTSIRILKKYLSFIRKTQRKNIRTDRKNKRISKEKQKDLMYKVKKDLVNYMKSNNLPSDGDSITPPKKQKRRMAFYYTQANAILQTLKTAQAVKHKETLKELNYLKDKALTLLKNAETKSNDYMKFIALTGPSEHHNTTQGYSNQKDITAELRNKKTYVISTKANKKDSSEKVVDADNINTENPVHADKDSNDLSINTGAENGQEMHTIDPDIEPDHVLLVDDEVMIDTCEAPTEQIETSMEKNERTSTIPKLKTADFNDTFSDSFDDFDTDENPIDHDKANRKTYLQQEIENLGHSIAGIKAAMKNFSGIEKSREFESIEAAITKKMIEFDDLKLSDFPDLINKRKEFITSLENVSKNLKKKAKNNEVQHNEKSKILEQPIFCEKQSSQSTSQNIIQASSEINFQFEEKIGSEYIETADVQEFFSDLDDEFDADENSISQNISQKNNQASSETNFEFEVEFGSEYIETADIQEIFSDSDDDFGVDQNPIDPEKANLKTYLQKKMKNISYSIAEIKAAVEDFSGIESSHEYNNIDVAINEKILKFSELKLSDFLDVDHERRKFIISLENLSKDLKNKAKKNEEQQKNINNTLINNDVGLSWICSKETCGFHYNEYTTEALNALKSVFEDLAVLKYEALDEFTTNMFKCTAERDPEKMGHTLQCYDYGNLNKFENKTDCKDPLLTLKRLNEHFPTLRTITRRCYSLKESFLIAQDLRTIYEEPADEIYRMYLKYKHLGEIEKKSSSIMRPTIDINSIYDKYKNEIEEVQASSNPNLSHDLPLYVCFSCKILYKFTQVSDLTKLRSYPEDCHHWNSIIEHNNIDLNKIKEFKMEKNRRRKQELLEEFKDKYYICLSCKEKFQQKKLPPKCILNKMDVCPRNEIIESLNEYERLLISRAHTFRTILTASNKSGRKNIPSNRQHKKTTGVSIHLPLDINATLKSVLSDKEVLNTSNLQLSVSSKAGKKKIIWQDVVNIQKVYNAVKFLKDEVKNPHYATLLDLPESPQEFADKYLKDEIPQIEYDPDPEDDDALATDDSNIDNPSHDTSGNNTKNSDKETNQKNNGQPNDANTTECSNTEIRDESDSLLTKLSPQQLQHNKEYYTIMPIHNNRQIDKNLPKYGLNRVEGDALSDFTEKDLDTLTHPDIFYNGQYGENDPARQIHIGKSAYAEARLMSSDPRFRHDKTYLFDLANSKTKRDINSAIFQTLNVKKDGTRRTAGEILNDDKIDKDINTVFSKVRGTDEYMKIKRCDTETMLTNYGPATWFLTLSPNEWMWEDLKPFLSDIRVNPDLHEKANEKSLTTSELSVLDPVMTAVFIENRFQKILKFICSKANPLGEVSHYTIRREYQGRLVSHFHCMLWVDAAPTIGDDDVTEEDVAEYIQKYVTCELPPVGSKLHEIVKSVQMHRCNPYCTRTYKLQNNKQTKGCRFKFPREPRDTFVLNDLAASAAAKKTHSKVRLYELPRNIKERNVNDYCPVLMFMWWSNMDLQFIKERTCTVAHYIGKYAFKAEETNLNADFLRSTKSPQSVLYSIALKGLAGREVGTIEAADTLLGHFLVKTDPDTVIRFVDTSPNKFRKLKSKQELLLMEHTNSTEIFVPNNVDDRYPNRPKDMEDCNLFDYISNYEFKGLKGSTNWIELQNGMGFILKRSKPTLISHRKPNKINDKEEYYRNLLTLFKPYRKPIEVKTKETYEESFNDEILNNERLKEYEHRISEMYESRENMKKRIMEERIIQESEPAPESFDFTTDNSTDLIEEFEKANQSLPTNYEDLFALLNEDQRRIFLNIISRLHSQTKIPVPENMKDHIISLENSKQILKYVSGVGGTGKSFLITVITAYIKKVLQKDVALVAPTGIAASNINGFTIHRFLKLPVQHNTIPKYAPLSDKNLNESAHVVNNVILWFVDEVSMLNNITLQYIHKRMNEINAKEGEVFGGNNIIFVGDLLQLIPVQEDEVFVDITKGQKKKYLNNLVAPQLWKQLEFDELTINQRQQEDPIFAKILNNIRNGNLEENDYNYLNEKCTFSFPDNANPEENRKYLATFVIEEQKKGRDYTILLPTNKLCKEVNNAILDLHDDLRFPNAKYIPAKDIVVRRKRQATNFSDKDVEDRIRELEEDPRNTAGLERTLKLKIGSKVMLRQNLDIPSGLCNGAIGTLVDVVEMDGEVHHLVVNFNGKEHNIERRQSDFFLYPNNLIKVTRSQFPITLSYCLTVHKSQGLTLRHAIMDCGQDIFSVAQIYVALSRVKKAEDLKLLNFRVDSIKASQRAIQEYARLRRVSGLRSHDMDSTPINKFKSQKYKHQQYTTAPSKRRKIAEPPIFDGTGSEVTSNENQFATFKKDKFNFANALLQCFFQTIHPNTINKDKNLHELNSLLEQYNRKIKNIDTNSLRKSVINHENYNKSLTPQEFLEILITSNETLKKCFQLKITETKKCVSATCTYSMSSKKEKYLFSLVQGKCSNTMQKIIEENYTTFTKSEVCDHCKGSLKVQNAIDPSDYIVFNMNYCQAEVEKNHKTYLLKIKGIPNNSIIINDQTYVFTAMVQHIGQAIHSNNTKYAALFKKNKVSYIIRDEKVNNLKQWLDHGVDTNTYGTPHLLFYKRK